MSTCNTLYQTLGDWISASAVDGKGYGGDHGTSNTRIYNHAGIVLSDTEPFRQSLYM